MERKPKYTVDYPTTYNPGDPCGRNYGPTDAASRSFPQGVYLTAQEWEHYNAEIFLERQVQAQKAFEEAHPDADNIYDPFVKQGVERLAELEPLPAKPCGGVPA